MTASTRPSSSLVMRGVLVWGAVLAAGIALVAAPIGYAVAGAPGLVGGLLGAAYVTSVLVTVRELGAGPVVAATIAGQLTMSVVLDQFGLLGLPKDPITVGKVVGIVLLSLGVYLVVRE